MRIMRKLIHSPIFWTIVILLIIARITAPRIILQKANAILADFSPIFQGHVEDLDLGIIRGAYKLNGLELRLKDKTPERFVKVDVIDVSVAWREIFKGRLVTDIVVDNLNVVLTNNVLEAFKKSKKQADKDSKEAASKIFPVRVERLEIKNSSLQFADLLSIPDANRWKLTDIQARASNLTPTQRSPLTLATIQGKLFDQAVIRIVGNLVLNASPPAWDVDLELKNFNLPNANGFLSKKVPLTITSGTLDLYSEAISEKGRIEGYAKPFVHKADIVADKEKFKGFKHATIEISSATANLLFRSAKERTVATKIKFSYDDSGFKVNTLDALADAIKNGFQEKIPEGLDDEITLPKTLTKGQ
jgi:hypothetical protein